MRMSLRPQLLSKSGGWKISGGMSREDRLGKLERKVSQEPGWRCAVDGGHGHGHGQSESQPGRQVSGWQRSVLDGARCGVMVLILTARGQDINANIDADTTRTGY